VKQYGRLESKLAMVRLRAVYPFIGVALHCTGKKRSQKGML
jgi:hypothetical protein